MAVATATSNKNLPLRIVEADTLTEGLDYAARGETGLNFYSPRGDLTQALTYAEIREQAIGLAQRFVRAGYQPGTRVAILAETAPHFQIFFFGCQYAGMIPVPLPLNIHMGGRDAYVQRLAGMLRESQAKAAVASADMVDFLRDASLGLGIDCGTPEDFFALPFAGAELRPFGKDDPCYIQYSSGSTSSPRGVLITQRAITSNARGIGRHGLQLRPGDRSVSWLPLYHDMGLVGFCLTPMMSQVTVDYLATASFARRPLVWLKLLTANGSSISFSPTFGYDLCRRRGLNGSAKEMDLRTWRVAGVGGEMVRSDILQGFADVFSSVGFDPKAFVPSYGLAESTLAVSFSELDRGAEVDVIDRDIFSSTGRAVPVKRNGRSNGHLDIGATAGNGTLIIGRNANGKPAENARSFVFCGRSMPEHRIEVRDQHNNPLSDRRVGHIMVSGPSVMAGYFKNPDRTRAVTTEDGWLDTGDLGYMVDERVVITGRRKDLIIQNGRNIWPQDIEWAVEQMENIRDGDVACFGVEDDGDDGDNEVIVVVECRLSDEAARGELQKDVASTVYRTSGVHCRVVLVPTRSLTFTSSGKLSRAAVKADYLAGALTHLSAGELEPLLRSPKVQVKSVAAK